MLSGSETAITLIPIQKVHQLEDSRKNNRIKKLKTILKKNYWLYFSWEQLC